MDDQILVERAQKRAMITGYLSQNGERSVGEIAENTDMSRIQAGLMLKHMADENLVQLRQEGLQKFYSMGSAPSAPHELVDLAEDSGIRRRRRRGSKEVELVVSGTMIVIGRNPESGRLRISLEDVE